jgi:hypothetical protein
MADGGKSERSDVEQARVALLRPATAKLRRAPEAGDFGLGKASRAGVR